MLLQLSVDPRQYVGNPIDCVHTKDIPEDVLEKEGQIRVKYFVKKERILVMCLDIQAKTFSIKGKWWAKWEEHESRGYRGLLPQTIDIPKEQ